jgi:hypothetical protein
MKKFFVNPKTGKVRKIRTALVVIVGLGIIGNAFGDDTTSKPATTTTAEADQPTKKEETKAEPAEKFAKIGEPATAGKLVYTVNSVEEKKELKNALGSKQPGSGTFVILELTIENKDNEGRAISEAMTKLVDKDGNEFEPSSDAYMYMDNNSSEQSMFNNINPKGKKTFKIVYDVAGSAEDYTFVGTGGFDLVDNGEAKIQLKK